MTDKPVRRYKIYPVDLAIMITLILLIVLIICLVVGVKPGERRNPDTNGDGTVSLADYDGKKIGSITGVDYDDILEEYLPNATISYYSNYPDMVVALEAGIIDGFIIDEPALYPIIKQDPAVGYIPESMSSWDMAFVFSPVKDKGDLCSLMTEFVRESKKNGVLAEIEEIWFGDDESRKVIPPLDELPNENGVIRVALETTYEPIVYVKDKQIVGYEIDILYRFCQKYHYGMDISDMVFDSVLPAVVSGKYDIGASGFEISEEHLEAVDMCESYYSAGTLLAVNAGDLDSAQHTEEGSPIGQIGGRIWSSIDKNLIKERRWELVLQGIGVTCLITSLSIFFGSLIGFGICLLRRSKSRLANPIFDSYVRIIQGIPTVVLLMILFYVVFGRSNMEAMWVAVIGFTLSFGAESSVIMRGGLDAVDKGQREAALALGFTDLETFFRFLFPQAAVHFLPMYSAEMISLLNETSIVGYIAVQDITKMGDIIRSRSYEAAMPLLISTLVYFLLARVIYLLVGMLLKAIKPRRKKIKGKGGDV